ncbi:MAG: DUF6443 domain-containing protein, partial [Dysgonamonadaceae bacterium]|nr:DUF6443 domain-containing protein [Dysgonamonadaceae bacterium]
MKQLLFIIIVSMLGLFRLTAQDTLVLNTSNTKGGVINACAAIILKPGFSFTSAQGKSLSMKTGDAYCSPYVTQSLNLSDDQNYVVTVTPLSETDSVNISQISLTLARNANAQVSVQYFDGLGRPLETVQKGITPTKADLVTYQEYDGFGRESKSWLPARATNNNGAFVNFTDFQNKASATYNNTTYNAVADAAPYSYPVYEASPLNRITQQYAPGAAWHNNDKSLKTEYLTNNSTYSCLSYAVSGDNLVKNGNYADNQLYVTKMTDEENNVSYEFKDKLGQVVLQRQMDGNIKHDTYYVYDDFGNLRFVIPPIAADASSVTTANLNNYIYQYKYDSRNRCIAKKIPGADWVYYVYDKADRLIFSQDGEQRKTGEWSFSIPDVFGRVVLSGFCKNTLAYDGNPLASVVVKAERVNATNTYKGYTLSGITLTSAKVLSVNYYDNYEFMGYNGIPSKTNSDFKYETVSGYGEQHSGTQGYEHKGLLTGTLVAYNKELTAIARDSITIIDKPAVVTIGDSLTRVVPNLQKAKYYEEAAPAKAGTLPAGTTVGMTNPDMFVASDMSWEYLASVMYYDYRGQLVQSKSENHLSGVEKEYLAYNFTGQPTKRKLIHSASGKATQTEVYTYVYDHAGRLTQTKHQLNTGAEMVLANNTYDELGRLKATKANNQSKLETTYAYNIRSWLNGINNYHFDELLSYTYNGNISSMSWFQDRYRQNYSFGYDNLSRIRSASFSGFNREKYSATYTYDKHGNITSLYRYGGIYPALGAYGYIDRLTMNYGNTNQLRNINDSGENVLSNPSDFKDYKKGSSVEYTYNANGAMTQDLNKGISEIKYNRLNLPQRIDIKSPVAEARNEYT